MNVLTKTVALGTLATSIMIAANPAQAAIVQYTNRASFLNAIQPGYYLETFNSVSITGTTASPINFSNGTYSYRASVPDDFYGAGSNANRWLSTNIATDTITFSNFSPAITAIGGYFFASNVNGALTAGTINATVNGGSSSLSASTNSALNFFGFVSTDGTPLTSLETFITQPNGAFIWPTVNDLIVGQAQPVPEPLTILGTATAAGLGVVLKRRAKKLTTNKID
ncbi:PEP-CTERM sorting domain-containing protein [Fortiea contorta]|uniref:PEP-CTERM sorting domain-containing protein n=1 Tax=Fortiea contorta TaxID=1892405 RepID=UPI00034D53D9|nr:PEP-CTERM sorting domain-containing protein [Fortiea contorta]